MCVHACILVCMCVCLYTSMYVFVCVVFIHVCAFGWVFYNVVYICNICLCGWVVGRAWTNDAVPSRCEASRSSISVSEI